MEAAEASPGVTRMVSRVPRSPHSLWTRGPNGDLETAPRVHGPIMRYRGPRTQNPSPDPASDLPPGPGESTFPSRWSGDGKNVLQTGPRNGERISVRSSLRVLRYLKSMVGRRNSSELRSICHFLFTCPFLQGAFLGPSVAVWGFLPSPTVVHIHHTDLRFCTNTSISSARPRPCGLPAE